MKSHRVILSIYCKVVTGVILSVLVACLFYADSSWAVGVASATLICLCALALWYMPLAVSVNARELCMRRPLKAKRIPLSEISSIELIQPTMAEVRVCGSGGWFGYWGWFREGSIGSYFACYGKASDCFIVRLRSGRQYMFGCEHPEQIVDYVAARLKGD